MQSENGSTVCQGAGHLLLLWVPYSILPLGSLMETRRAWEFYINRIDVWLEEMSVWLS